MTINLSELNFTNDFTSVPMPKGNTLVMNKVNESLKVAEAKLEDNKEVTITENGTVEITPSEGYDGMKKVTATVNVAGGGGYDVEPFHAYILSYEVVEVCVFGGENTVKILKGTDHITGKVYDCIPYRKDAYYPLIPCIGVTLFVMRTITSGGLSDYALMIPEENIEIGQSVEGYFKIVNGEYTEITDSSEVAVEGITYYNAQYDDAHPPFLVEWNNKQYLCESSEKNEAIPEYTE